MRLDVGALVFSAKNKNKLYILGHTSFISWVSCKNRIEFDKGSVDCTKQANALLPNKLDGAFGGKNLSEEMRA